MLDAARCSGMAVDGTDMDRELIIRLAREAGWPDSLVAPIIMEKLAEFAALVAAHEREECAKVCEEFCDDPYAVLTAECIRRRNQE